MKFSKSLKKIKVFEIIKVIRFTLDPSTKLIQNAKRNHLCKKTDTMGTLDDLRYRIYWEELEKSFVPQPEFVSYLNDDGEIIKMKIDIIEKFFTNFHDLTKILKLEIEFQKPLGIRSI